MTQWSNSFSCTLHYLIIIIMQWRIWMHWTSKMLVRCIQSSVSKFMSILAIVFHATYVAVCIQFTHFSYDDCQNTCTWFYYHNQIGSMTHLPLSRVRSWNNGILVSLYVFLYSFYIVVSICRPNVLLYIWTESIDICTDAPQTPTRAG